MAVIRWAAPLPIFATAGESAPLATAIAESFTAPPSNWTNYWVYYFGEAYQAKYNFGYWPGPTKVAHSWMVAGVDRGELDENLQGSAFSVSAANLPTVQALIGNTIGPFLHMQVSAMATAGPVTNLIVYDYVVVDPALKSATAGVRAPTAAEIVLSAQNFDAFYGHIRNPDDCSWVAMALSGAAGATLSLKTQSLIPSENEEGGFWRIAYRGSDPGQAADWTRLVQPGDIVRLGWAPGDGFHMLTVISKGAAAGQITVYDNNRPDAGGITLGLHVENSLQTRTRPETITIYRLTTDNLYLMNGSADPESLPGTIFNDMSMGLGGDDILNGGTGNDMLDGGLGNDKLDGGAGFDTASYVSAGAGVSVRLLLQGQAQNVGGAGSDTLVSIENLTGSGFADSLFGDGAENHLRGAGGDDALDGGGGLDVAAYGAAAANYDWWQAQDGSWKVKDLRPGGPEGVDTLTNIESLGFSDKVLKIAGLTTAEKLTDAYSNILRSTASGAELTFLNNLIGAVNGSTKTLGAAITEIVAKADQTTAVAAMSYQFFLNFVPSKGGFDYLVSPQGPNANNINSAYYQSFNIENRYINFAVNLGKAGEGAPSFLAEYGAKTLFQATKDAYMEIFGGTVVDSKINTILDSSVGSMSRAQYFALYGGDGLSGIGTKAAMVGWLLTEAAKADLGMYANSSNAFLTDLADGAQTLVDVVGAYGKAEYIFNG